jgi:hypothetical protein
MVAATFYSFFFFWLLPRGAWYFLFWQRYPPGVLLHFQRTGLDSLFSLVILLLAVYSFSGNSKFLLLDVSRISSSSLSSEFCYLFFSFSFSFPSVCIDPFFISLFYSREIGNYGESNKKKTLLITARENYKCGGYIQCERRFVLKLRPKRGREERSFIPFAFFLFLFQSSLFPFLVSILFILSSLLCCVCAYFVLFYSCNMLSFPFPHFHFVTPHTHSFFFVSSFCTQ